MPLKCIVIDDESDAIEIISDYINEMPQLTLSDTYTDPLEAMSAITSRDKIDLIFIDVDMPRLSGIDLGKAIRHKVDHLIFTTAHTKYAFDAFEIEADAYLLKPFGFSKFALTLGKLIKSYDFHENAITDRGFFVKTTDERNRLIRVNIDEVIAVESEKNYIKIYSVGGEILTYLTLKEIKEHLDKTDDFIQTHRSFLVSKKYIERIDGTTVRMVNNLIVPVGANYRDEFSTYLSQKTIKTGRRN